MSKQRQEWHVESVVFPLELFQIYGAAADMNGSIVSDILIIYHGWGSRVMDNCKCVSSNVYVVSKQTGKKKRKKSKKKKLTICKH